MKHWKHQIEWHFFVLFTNIGERLGISRSVIRLWFIYVTFLTVGSPIIIYMIIMFWKNIKNYILLSKRNPLKYL